MVVSVIAPQNERNVKKKCANITTNLLLGTLKHKSSPPSDNKKGAPDWRSAELALAVKAPPAMAATAGRETTVAVGVGP